MIITHPVPYVQLSASGVIKAGPGYWDGAIVIASAALIFKIFDNPSAASGTVLYDSSTAVTAGQIITLGGIGIQAKTGLFFSITSGTGTVNVMYI